MVHFEKFVLDNGLTVLVNEDRNTPMVAMNILYNVGARDEHVDMTGFAHLFEHLMFGGSPNIPKYDTPLENAGGENNAFTNNDITDYYLTIPASNIETGFWLESDRMNNLAFSEKSLEVQRHVVIEEYKQSYLNQPYGDVWLLLRPLAYLVHPYQWPTIGKDISHISEARLQDVRKFFTRFYNPANAIMTLSGNIDPDQAFILSKKWFGPISKPHDYIRNIPAEPAQEQSRQLAVRRNVPYDAIYKAWHMCHRTHPSYHPTDLISDILGNGKSSRLYLRLVKERKIFSEISAFITGDLDEGLFIVQGKLVEGVKMKEAEDLLISEIDKISSDKINGEELRKVKNKVESNHEFSLVNIINRAINLSFFELIGDAGQINQEVSKYFSVTARDIKETALGLFRAENCSTLYYYSDRTK